MFWFFVVFFVSVLFRGPETFHCERSVIQTSHWAESCEARTARKVPKKLSEMFHTTILRRKNVENCWLSYGDITQSQTFVSPIGLNTTHSSSKLKVPTHNKRLFNTKTSTMVTSSLGPDCIQRKSSCSALCSRISKGNADFRLTCNNNLLVDSWIHDIN